MDKRSLGKEIKILSNQMRRKFEKDLAKQSVGLPMAQSRIIGFLYRESLKKAIFQKDIEDEFDIRRSSATNILQLMEKNGYIERVSVVEDARLKKIILTEKSLAIQEKTIVELDKIESSLRKIYSEEEWDQLFHLLDKLSNHLLD